jgi:hypothetical protein
MNAVEKVRAGRPTLGKGLMAMGTVILVGEILYALAQAAPW